MDLVTFIITFHCLVTITNSKSKASSLKQIPLIENIEKRHQFLVNNDTSLFNVHCATTTNAVDGADSDPVVGYTFQKDTSSYEGQHYVMRLTVMSVESRFTDNQSKRIAKLYVGYVL